MRRVLRSRALGLALVALVAPRVDAQSSCTTNSTIRAGSAARTCTFTINTPNSSTYTNPKTLQLTASSTSIVLTADEAAFVSGFTPEASLTVRVDGNRSWVITASGPALWTASGSLAWNAKPVDDLRWSTTAGAAGTPLSTTATTIASGSAGSALSTTLYWKAALAWTTDKPGNYSLPVTLTLTTP